MSHAKVERQFAGYVGDERLKPLLEQIEREYARYERTLEIAQQSLDLSTRELMEANKSLEGLHQSVTAMVNSLGQGFFGFDRNGICLPIYSRACRELLECEPAGKSVVEVLKVIDRSPGDFNNWIQLLFEEPIDFEDLAVLGPATFPHSNGRHIVLEFKPMRAFEGHVSAIICVATDKTDELAAKKEALERQSTVDMILKLTRDRNSFVLFVKKTREMISLLRSMASLLRAGSVASVDLTEVRRLLHTIKGGAASFYIKSIRDLAHELENVVPVDGVGDPRVLRKWAMDLPASIDALENALNQCLETQKDLLGSDFESGGYTREVAIDKLYEFTNKLRSVSGAEPIVESFLQEFVAVPVRSLVITFESVIQDLATRRSKKLKPLEIVGGEIKLLAEAYDEFFSTMVHLFTNAVDHGIELPEEREAIGKDAAGTIRVEITESKGGIEFVIRDDGRGISAKRISEKLKAQGAPESVWNAPESELILHIFDAGLSTAQEITDSSGRGVGLDAFKAVIDEAGGSIDVSTEWGVGTCFRIWMPRLATTALKSAA